MTSEKLIELKKMVDDAYNNASVTRQRAADDLVFYWVTQWDDMVISSDLQFRGEFNILRKAGRQIMADLRSNPIQVNFEPVDETRDDASEILDGLYRADDRRNTSQEAYFNAMQEQVVCGIGAWELYTEYENIRGNSRTQRIVRSPIHEANNCVFWDPNSKLMDKSDANYVCILTRYSKEAYEELVEKMQGEDAEHKAAMSNFKNPQYSYTFPWVAGDFEWVFIGTIYERELEDDVIVSVMDPITQEISEYYESELKDKIDTLLESGSMVVGRKELKRYMITKYICSGEMILNGDEGEMIAGEYIPVVPVYGERAIVEDQETWEGIVKLAKDPSRLRNFLMSYIADIASRSPRVKPMFYPEQIQGFESMYDTAGSDNQYPYYLINSKDANGNPLPPGQIATMPEQTIPQAVAALVEMTKTAIQDVAGDPMPKDFADIDLSGEAIAQLNARIDMQSVVYQENMKHAKRRDAQIYASMASRIYDVPRDVKMVLPDGTIKRDTVMKNVFDIQTGKNVVLNDLRNAQFDVYTEIGPTYQSQKDKLRRELSLQIQSMPPDDPMRMFFMLKYAELMDGVGTKDIREYAKKQMILQGFKEPETPEEQQALQEAQQQQQKPDPAQTLAEAEVLKGQAQMMREQNAQVQIAGDLEKKRADTSVDIFNAQTQRFVAETNAEVKGADIQIKNADLIGRQYAEMAKQLDKPVGRSSVHGKVTERDIRDTMQKYGMTREQVLAKLGQLESLHSTMSRSMKNG